MTYADLYIYMPRFKQLPKFNTIHLNGRQVFAVTGKTRLKYRLISEGVLQVSNVKNVRTKGASSLSINVVPDQSFYVKIDRKGKLSLMKDPTAAKKEYEDNSVFTTSVIEKVEDRVLPIPGMSIAREVERRTALAELEKLKLEETKGEIETFTEEFFEELKEQEELNDRIQPKIEVTVEKGRLGEDGFYQYNLRTSYSYDYEADEEGVSAELINYPSGSYTLESSKAALATANAMKESIDRYLYKYFEPGSIIKVRIVGSADSSPIRRALSYKQEYEAISNEIYYLTDKYNIINNEAPSIDSLKREKSENEESQLKVDINKQTQSGKEMIALISDNQNTFSTNEDLAYLRAKGIQHFIQENVQALQKTRNIYFFQVKIENGIGGNYRKVVIELLIEDILRGK